MTESWKQWEGQVINGEFRLQAYLGGSDRSAVFLTERSDGRELRKAAIKLTSAHEKIAGLRPHLWERAAQLSHPHLIRLFQEGQCELGGTQLHFVVMEYAEETLAQILPQRPLTPAETRDMLWPVLGALAYLDRQGFVHGHLKPTNILAVADVVKISSDGLCAVSESRREVRKIGVYEPPEAASGIVSPAGDAWSLGMTLVEAMTQRLPVWDAREHGEPSLPEGIPQPFLEIARNCLRRDPQQRWTVAQIAERLQPVSPVPAVPTSPREPATARKASTMWRYIVPAAVLGVVLLMVAGLRKESQSPRAEPAASEAAESPAATAKPAPAMPVTRQPATAAKREGPAAAPAVAARSGNVVPGTVLHQVVPEASKSARNTITGKVRVRVRVKVDSAGNVTDAAFQSPGPSKYFARLAMQAAPGWKFTPPQVNGRAVSSEWILRFAFGRAGTEVYQVQTRP